MAGGGGAFCTHDPVVHKQMGRNRSMHSMVYHELWQVIICH